MNLEINVEAPWTSEDDLFICSSQAPKFIITGTDANTGRKSSYHNATFGWGGANDDVQIWFVGGDSASYCLNTIDSFEKIVSGKSMELKLPSGSKTLYDNVELMSEIIKNKGESISMTWKKPSGISHTIYVDILPDTPSDEPPKIIDSYLDKPVSFRSIAKVLSLEGKNTRDLEL